MKIGATILADSFCHTRLTTFLLTYPRIILPEVNTHCILAKNSSSSRAIPVARRIEQVRNNPFVPRYLGKNKPGMQAVETIDQENTEEVRRLWIEQARSAADTAEKLAASGLHKQLANRVLEPYVYTQTVISGTDWENFFALRVSKDAQDEFFELALAMLEAYIDSRFRILQPGEWHLPFGKQMDENWDTETKIRVSAARCARLSYETHNGVLSVDEDLKLADGLLASGHMSPFQHQAQAVVPGSYHKYNQIEPGALIDRHGDVRWGQFRWWRMYRKTLKNETWSCDLLSLREEGRKLNKERQGA